MVEFIECSSLVPSDDTITVEGEGGGGRGREGEGREKGGGREGNREEWKDMRWYKHVICEGQYVLEST